MRKGFYIEAGAADGLRFSNSLFFELKRDWTGMLVEPELSLYSQLLKTNRKAWKIGNCFSTKKHPEIVDFDAADLFGKLL